MATIEDIKAFAEAKQKETRSELHTAMDMQVKYGEAFGQAVGAAQRALRAYTSILEGINGEHPCDPIYKDDE